MPFEGVGDSSAQEVLDAMRLLLNPDIAWAQTNRSELFSEYGLEFPEISDSATSVGYADLGGTNFAVRWVVDDVQHLILTWYIRFEDEEEWCDVCHLPRSEHANADHAFEEAEPDGGITAHYEFSGTKQVF